MEEDTVNAKGKLLIVDDEFSVRDSLIEDYGVPPERITVVPPGIDLRRYRSVDRGAVQGRERRPLGPRQ